MSVVVGGGVVGGLLANTQVQNAVSAIGQHKSIEIGSGALAPVGYGAPQTLLLVGNDQRAPSGPDQAVLPHSNEMLLVRFDPSKPFISMMSLPRELLVPIDTAHGVVENRFNSAFTFGSDSGGFGAGVTLMLKTVKQVTGLPVNNVVVIDFNQFQQAINDMGCVYSTVDRPYYHLNVASDPQDNYFQINLQPGYQEMCGTQALQFVAYRHGDLSTIRDARDQDFLLDLKQEFGRQLTSLGSISKFEKIFGNLVQTDHTLQTRRGLLDLLGTLISSAGDPVRQVKFKVTYGNPAAAFCSCDTATPAQIQAAAHSFLYGSVKTPTNRSTKNLTRKKVLAKVPVVRVPGSEVAEVKQVALSANLGFPLEYPRLRDAGAAGGGSPIDLHQCVAVNDDDTYPLSCMRTYTINGPDRKRYPAYVIVTSNGSLGQYYDIEGTTWTAAPIFDNPTQTVHVRGRTYALYYQGANIENIAWFEHGAVYWVHNTLLNALSNAEMLVLAEHTLPVDAPAVKAGSGGGGTAASLPPTVVPVASSSSGVSSIPQKIGLVGGLVALLSMPFLLWLAVRRVRHNAGLRERLQDLSLRESALIVRAGSAGLPVSALSGGVGALGVSGSGFGVGSDPGVNLYSGGGAGGGGRFGWFTRRRLAVRGLMMLIVVVVVVAAGVLVSSAVGRGSSNVVHHLAPTVAVEVLNATPAHGVAAALANRLRSRGVQVAGVGNLVASLHHRDYVLYARGQKLQARRLAYILGPHTVKPEPISAAQTAVIGRVKLAVVIG